MNESRPKQSKSLLARWWSKFGCATRGLIVGARGQNSFCVHLPATVVVLALGAWLGVSVTQWSILLICIAMVLAAELFNSSLEYLAKAITEEDKPEIRDALDVASSAVLVASLGALAVGCLVLVWPFVLWLVGE